MTTSALAPRALSGVIMPTAALTEVLEPWGVIIDRWLAAQLSPRTRESYGREARQFTQWCEERGLDPRVARRHDLEGYRNTREAAGDSARTIARRLSTLSSAYTYGMSYGLPGNPTVGVRRPRFDRTSSSSQSLARDEAPALLAAAGKDSPRSAALAALLLLTALRVSEAVAAKIEDLGYDKGHRTLTIKAKGGAEVKIPLPPIVAHSIEGAIQGRTTGPILVTRTGRAMDRRQAHGTIKRLAKAAGVADAEHIGPHDLRHSAITAILECTGSIDAGQRLARHKSPVTTQVYDHRRRNLDDHPSYALAGYLAVGL